MTGPKSFRVLAAIVFLAAAQCCFGQSFGLKFAFPTANVFQTNGNNVNPSYTFHSRPPKFGLTGELSLPAGMLVEIDALYSRLSYRSVVNGVDAMSTSMTTANTWDFPILLKKELLRRRIKPFIDGGPAFRAMNTDSELTTTVFTSTVIQTQTQSPEFIHQATVGFAAGAGLDFKFGKYHVVPEFRYMRFQKENFQSANGAFQSNLKQPMILVGIQRGR